MTRERIAMIQLMMIWVFIMGIIVGAILHEPILRILEAVG